MAAAAQVARHVSPACALVAVLLLGVHAAPCSALQMDGATPPDETAALQGAGAAYGFDDVASVPHPSIPAPGLSTFRVDATATAARAVRDAGATAWHPAATGGDRGGANAGAAAAQGVFGAYTPQHAIAAPQWGGGSTSSSFGDLLRGMVNVAPAVGGANGSNAVHGRHWTARRDGPSGVDLGLSDLVRKLLMSTVTVHARGNGRVSFSIFGLGDFVANVRRDLSGFSVTERDTGLSFTHQYVSYPTVSGDDTASASDSTPDADDQAADLPVQPGGIVVEQVSIGDLIGRIRALTVGNVWFYVLLGLMGSLSLLRKLTALDRRARERRRRHVVTGTRVAVAAEAQPILAGAPSAPRATKTASHAHRVRRRRRRTSPNALRAFLRRALRLR